MKKLTLDDIARMANVSSATVSRVLNGQVGTRSKARERVLQVLAETGYQPHAAARSLASQRSHVIGLVIPAPASRILSHPYLLYLAEVITQACYESDYVLSLFLTGSSTEEPENLRKVTRRGLVDGLIVRGIDERPSEPLLEKVTATGIPFVAVGRPRRPGTVSYVTSDNETGAYNAVTHLLRLGRKRIGLIVGGLETSQSQDRLAGYRRALDERNVPVDPTLIASGGADNGYEAAQAVLAHRPDALFMPTRMAWDIARALRDANLTVPDDIALIGFDDLPQAASMSPPLTTLRQPMAAVGRSLVETLLDIIAHGPVPPRQLVFGQELVVRGSCGAVRG